MAEMTFSVVLADHTKVKDRKPGKKPSAKKDTPSWEEEGIQVRKYMGHPTCQMCGLEDFGKEAVERPDRNHMRSCRARKMDPYPSRVGAFSGEGLNRQLRFPYRVIRAVPIPIMDEEGNKVGEEDTPRFYCSYKYNIEEIYDWIWNGEKWVEWFTYLPEEKKVLPNLRDDPTADPQWLEMVLGKKALGRK